MAFLDKRSYFIGFNHSKSIDAFEKEENAFENAQRQAEAEGEAEETTQRPARVRPFPSPQRRYIRDSRFHPVVTLPRIDNAQRQAVQKREHVSG